MRMLNAAALIGATAMMILGLGSGIAWAAHDDTTIVGLVVTVTDNTNSQVTIDVAGQGYDSSSLPSARLGSQFFYDGSTLDRWATGAPPAVDWGDGSSVLNAGVPFTGSNSGLGTRTFTGQFMHTYAAPGNYTIRAFGSNVYGSYYSAVSGNVFTLLDPSIVYSGGSSTYPHYSGNVPIGITNTATASVAGGGGGGAGGGGVPAPIYGDPVRSGNCGLIGIELLALYPVWAIARRKRRDAIA